MTQTTSQIVGQNVERLREESGQSVAVLCARIGMSRRFWYDVEDGTKAVSVTTLDRVAETLSVALKRHITVQDLLEEPRKRRELVGGRK